MRIILFLFVSILPIVLWAQCNGHPELCERAYNDVVFLTTHNAFNAAEEGFTLPNHNFGLTKQLEDGVRGLMLDVYDEGGVPTVYHGFAFLGTATLESNLGEIKDFLDANPTEVVTIIFECYVNADMMDSVFTHVGLKPMLHQQTLGEAWPTLQQMITTDHRLVVFSDCNDAGIGQEWYHYVWDFCVETHFTNNSPNDFSCEFNRGDSINDLFILNHFVTDATLGVGQPAQAEIVNEFDFFYGRADQCWTEKQKLPNFPTVDFHELGQTMAVVDSLNGFSTTLGVETGSINSGLHIMTKANGVFAIQVSTTLEEFEFSVYDTNGKLIHAGRQSDSTFTLDLGSFRAGIYLLRVVAQDGNMHTKLLKI